eukprot:500678_1
MKPSDLQDLQTQHQQLITKASNDPQLNKLIHNNKNDGLSLHENEKKSSTNKHTKYLIKSRSTASILPAINKNKNKTKTKQCTLPPTKKWSSINNKMRDTQFHQVLKLQKLVNYRNKKRLNKSYSTNILLNKPNNKNDNNRSLSWNAHLKLLQEYDYNRVILQELCSKIGFSNKDGSRLLSTLIARNNEIIENVSSALGFERNRIDSVVKSNKNLSESKTELNNELETMKQKFDNIKHQISTFNTSQNKHTQQLQLAQKIA